VSVKSPRGTKTLNGICGIHWLRKKERLRELYRKGNEKKKEKNSGWNENEGKEKREEGRGNEGN
jgi:hypothetical protein